MCSGMLFIDLRTLRGKIKLIEKKTLRRVKMQVEKRVKIKTIRNPARQSDLEPQNQVLSLEMSPCVLFLAGMLCGLLLAVREKFFFFLIWVFFVSYLT